MKKKTRIVVAVILAVLMIPSLMSFWVQTRLTQLAGLEVKGIFIPHLALPSYELKDVSLVWRDRIEVFSGNLKVSYPFQSLLTPNALRVKIASDDLSVRLLGSWAEMEGVEKAHINSLQLDFAFGREGVQEIYFVDVKSPEFQFHIQQADPLA